MNQTKVVDGVTYRLKRQPDLLSITDESHIWISKTGETLDLTEEEKLQIDGSKEL